jgi:hypothetical protein
MKRHFLVITAMLFSIASLVLTFSACKKDAAVTISDEKQLAQTLYADETTAEFTFTATGDWFATDHGNNVLWMKKVLCNGVETYSGSKGTYTFVVSLETNYAGAPRTVIFEIVSGNDKIAISITQLGTTKDGETPTYIALVSRILFYGVAPYDFTYDTQNRVTSISGSESSIPITYPSANTMVAIFEGEEWIFTLNSDGHIVKMRYPDGYEQTYEYEYGYLKKGEDVDWIWENGNLVSVPWEGGGETYTYSTILSKETNIAPWTTPMLLICGHGEAFYRFFPSTYFGKSSKYLVSSVTRDDNQREYRYETNADGYVTKVYQPWVDDDGNTWENLLYEIQYK